MSTRIVEVRAKVLKQNDLLARALRDRFHRAGTFVVSIVSSPGSGKTAFLEKLLGGLVREHRVAALVGDLATARRNIASVRPGMQIFEVSSRSGFGMAGVMEFLRAQLPLPRCCESTEKATL